MISFCFWRRRRPRFERFGEAARDAAFTTATVAAPATTPPAAAIATVRASSRRTDTSPPGVVAGSGDAGTASAASSSSRIASASSTSSATAPQATPGRGVGSQRLLVNTVLLDDPAAHPLHRAVHRLVRLEDPAHVTASRPVLLRGLQVPLVERRRDAEVLVLRQHA